MTGLHTLQAANYTAAGMWTLIDYSVTASPLACSSHDPVLVCLVLILVLDSKPVCDIVTLFCHLTSFRW